MLFGGGFPAVGSRDRSIILSIVYESGIGPMTSFDPEIAEFCERVVKHPLIRVSLCVKSARGAGLCRKESAYLQKIIYGLYRLPGYNNRAELAFAWGRLAIQEVESQLPAAALNAYAEAPIREAIELSSTYPRLALFGELLRGVDGALWALYKYEGDLALDGDRVKLLRKVASTIPHAFILHVLLSSPLPDLDDLAGFHDKVMQMRPSFGETRQAGHSIAA